MSIPERDSIEEYNKIRHAVQDSRHREHVDTSDGILKLMRELYKPDEEVDMLRLNRVVYYYCLTTCRAQLISRQVGYRERYNWPVYVQRIAQSDANTKIAQFKLDPREDGGAFRSSDSYQRYVDTLESVREIMHLHTMIMLLSYDAFMLGQAGVDADTAHTLIDDLTQLQSRVYHSMRYMRRNIELFVSSEGTVSHLRAYHGAFEAATDISDRTPEDSLDILHRYPLRIMRRALQTMLAFEAQIVLLYNFEQSNIVYKSMEKEREKIREEERRIAEREAKHRAELKRKAQERREFVKENGLEYATDEEITHLMAQRRYIDSMSYTTRPEAVPRVYGRQMWGEPDVSYLQRAWIYDRIRHHGLDTANVPRSSGGVSAKAHRMLMSNPVVADFEEELTSRGFQILDIELDLQEHTVSFEVTRPSWSGTDVITRSLAGVPESFKSRYARAQEEYLEKMDEIKERAKARVLESESLDEES